jgi:hypothetical protein
MTGMAPFGVALACEGTHPCRLSEAPDGVCLGHRLAGNAGSLPPGVPFRGVSVGNFKAKLSGDRHGYHVEVYRVANRACPYCPARWLEPGPTVEILISACKRCRKIERDWEGKRVVKKGK